MKALDLIEEHLIIRNTVGYEFLNKVPVVDIPAVMDFLKIINNYNRLKRIDNGKTN